MRLFALVALGVLGCTTATPTVTPDETSAASAASADSAASGDASGTGPAPAPAQDTAAVAKFPDDWVGEWTGDVVATGAAGAQPPFGMELHVAPIENSDRLTWTIIYDLPAGKQTRPYELQPMGDPGIHVQIDEKNGIVIDGFLVGATLYTQFAVANSLMTIQYRRVGDELWFDVLATQLDPPRPTGGGDVPDVSVYLMQTAQHGVLTRRTP